MCQWGEEMKKWQKVLIVVALCVVVLGIAFALLMPKPVTVPEVDLSTLPDGQYEGQFDNGIIAASVSVAVRDHRIEAIDLLSHRYGLGQKAEAVLGEVLAAQSLEVDAVSGATLSSNTILRAISNALAEGAE